MKVGWDTLKRFSVKQEQRGSWSRCAIKEKLRPRIRRCKPLYSALEELLTGEQAIDCSRAVVGKAGGALTRSGCAGR